MRGVNRPASAGFLFASICSPAKLTLMKLIDSEKLLISMAFIVYLLTLI